jgi:hypothetical protein
VILGQENVILQKNKIKMTFGPNLKLACWYLAIKLKSAGQLYAY